jgi:fibronectin-binding autotransporter adhesin
MKNPLRPFPRLAILVAPIFIAQLARAQIDTWTGSSGENWSTIANWSAGAIPGATTNVVFTNNAGAATSPGVVDNIVDAGFPGIIGSLQFANTNISGGAGAYHTTQIGAGQTLTVLGNLTVGITPDVANCQISATFTGAGALVMSNATAGLNVNQGDTGNNAQSTLNMTNLNTFNATIGGITVGVYNSPNPSVAREKGYLYLARTNVISFIGNAPRAYGNESQIEIGENLGNGSNIQVPMYLGMMNTIYVNSITVGADKQGSGALLAFNPSFTNANPTAYFRGTNGSSSFVSVWRVADNSNQTTTGSGTAGTVDFSNGSLDAMVNQLIIGESESGASSGNGAGTGMFTFTAGTNDVNTLYLGYRVGTGPGTGGGTGTMNVNGTGTLVANNAICMSYFAGGPGTLSYPSSTLNINGGTVLANTITNGLLADALFNAAASSFPVNINMTGGTLGITSLLGVAGTIPAPLNQLSLNNSTLQLQVSGIQTNIETYTLFCGGTTNVVHITFLPPISSYPATYPIIGVQGGVGSLNIGISNLPPASPAYQCYLSNDGNTVYLVLTSGPTVSSQVDVWSGAVNSNWDTVTANWDVSGNPVTYTNGFLVQFDDTATGPTAIDLATALVPASVTVSNNVLPYAFGGSGELIGNSSLIKDGTGSLIITNTGNNNFFGGITINAGTVQFGNGGANGKLPATDNVLDDGNLILDQSGNVIMPNLISGTGVLTQNGSNVVTLTASNSFSGTAVVNGGTLLVNGVLSGALTNATGTFIGGSGTNAGPVSVGGTLQPSTASGIPADFTSGGTLTLASGATLGFELNATNNTAGGGINDLLTVGGDLDADNNAVSLNFQGVPQSGVSYTLINFSGSQNGSFNSTVAGTHFAATLSQGTSPITVTLNGSGANLKWDSTANNLWNVGVSSNWLNQGSSLPDVFYAGDTVLFDDSVAGAITTLTIPSGVSVSPTAITNNSVTNNYIINGPGQINGNGNIVKQGVSKLTINSANVGFTGNLSIQAGTFVEGSDASIGADYGTPGPVKVNVSSGATFDLGGQTTESAALTVSGAGVNGAGAIVNSGAAQIHAVRYLALAGNTTFGGSNLWDIRYSGNYNGTLTSVDGSPYTITKVGSNEVDLVDVAVDQNLGNIDVQGGIFGLQLSTLNDSGGWAGDSTHSISVESNATLEFNSLSATAPYTGLNRTVALNSGSILQADSGATTMSGQVILQGNDIITVISSGSLLADGVVSGTGNLIKTGTFPLTLAAANSYTGNTLVEAGTLALSGSGSISSSPNIIVSAAAILDVSALTDDTLTLASGQFLQGNGTINGILSVGAGATVSAGTNSTTTGLLTVTNGVTLQGNTLLKLNPATGTNDVISAINTNNINYGGTLTLTNISATPLAAGRSFKLFAAATYTGAFTSIVPATPGAGLLWDTDGLTNGILSIVSSVVPQPGITSISLSGTSLIINGTNGLAGEQYNILTTTNLTLPLAQWTVLPTNTFSAGTFSLTNSVDSSVPQSYYIIRVP